MSDGCSLAEYARRRGLSRAAVTMAVRDGRLKKSVGRKKGRPFIIAVELADKEWATSTDYTRAPTSATGPNTMFWAKHTMVPSLGTHAEDPGAAPIAALGQCTGIVGVLIAVDGRAASAWRSRTPP